MMKNNSQFSLMKQEKLFFRLFWAEVLVQNQKEKMILNHPNPAPKNRVHFLINSKFKVQISKLLKFHCTFSLFYSFTYLLMMPLDIPI